MESELVIYNLAMSLEETVATNPMSIEEEKEQHFSSGNYCEKFCWVIEAI